MYNCALNGLANIFVHNKIEDFVGQTADNQSRRTPRRRASAGMWCLCVNTPSNIIEEGGSSEEGVDGKNKSTTTFFRQVVDRLHYVTKPCDISHMRHDSLITFNNGLGLGTLKTKSGGGSRVEVGWGMCWMGDFVLRGRS